MTALARMVGATAAGMTLSASFAPLDRWWAAPIGLALFTVCLSPVRSDRVTARSGALLGFLFGLGFFLLFDKLLDVVLPTGLLAFVLGGR